ncbi:MAG TPA: type I-C CRISPR-associated protein Cas8c/Csd1 [Thermoanaerobaculia bacterium]|jgi:CRISPR-associated protein Csd1|nr:type I-C CRISPR-associated protein Cas8c/Csd1 [Thermoanaerobaculia bacterium]
MLGALLDYAHDHELVAEPGFAPKLVRWALVCDADGRFLEVLDLAAEGSRGRTFKRCPELSQPEMKRGGSGCRHFLVDSADVVALLADGEPDAKLLAKHSYFTGLLRQAAAVLPELAGVAGTLDDPVQLAAIREGLRAGKAKPTDRVTFSLLGISPTYPVDSEAWHDWWRHFRRSLSPSSPGEREKAGAGEQGLARCLVTGELVEPVPTHPKIAGLSDVGGLSMGDVLASYKQEAFCSYGLVQSANAAVSEAAASGYRAALNHLIQHNGRRLAATKIVFWYKRDLEPADDLLEMLLGPGHEEGIAEQRARKLLAAIEAGERPDLLDNHYYALTLSGASGRVMVHDWTEGSFEDLVRNVNRWFKDLEIVRTDGSGTARAPRPYTLLASLVRELNEKTRNELAAIETGLWRAALRSTTRLPGAAIPKALARIRVDALDPKRPLSPARMGLLKAFLIRWQEGDCAMDPYLNENHPDPAYHCGRLMAMLAALQYRALGDVGAGVVQRYYASASATPALVLGRLMRTAQFHLDKLDRGLARWHEGRIADVWGRIRTAVPPTLDLEGQTVFALGYYQQIAADRSHTRPNAAAGETPEITSDDQETVS